MGRLLHAGLINYSRVCAVQSFISGARCEYHRQKMLSRIFWVKSHHASIDASMLFHPISSYYCEIRVDICVVRVSSKHSCLYRLMNQKYCNKTKPIMDAGRWLLEDLDNVMAIRELWSNYAVHRITNCMPVRSKISLRAVLTAWNFNQSHVERGLGKASRRS